MFVNGSSVAVPQQLVRDTDYEQGNQLRDSSLQELVSYYNRLTRYFFEGKFTDENNIVHQNPNFVPGCPMYQEILNEIDFEHGFTPSQYVAIYDAMVTEIMKICPYPQTKYVGLALGGHKEWNYYEIFLNTSNHKAGVPLDAISFHIYVEDNTQNHTIDELFTTYYQQMNEFIDEVQQIANIRDSLSPSTQFSINEIGCLYQVSPIPDLYWNLCASTYAYLFGKLSSMSLNVLIVGMSQVIGYPQGTYANKTLAWEWPCTSMMDWQTGQGNARYWVLKLIIQTFGTKEKTAVKMNSPNNSTVFQQAYILEDGSKVIFLVNQDINIQLVEIENVSGSVIQFVDQNTVSVAAVSGIENYILSSDIVQLNPFGVAVITIKQREFLKKNSILEFFIKKY